MRNIAYNNSELSFSIDVGEKFKTVEMSKGEMKEISINVYQ